MILNEEKIREINKEMLSYGIAMSEGEPGYRVRDHAFMQSIDSQSRMSKKQLLVILDIFTRYAMLSKYHADVYETHLYLATNPDATLLDSGFNAAAGSVRLMAINPIFFDVKICPELKKRDYERIKGCYKVKAGEDYVLRVKTDCIKEFLSLLQKNGYDISVLGSALRSYDYKEEIIINTDYKPEYIDRLHVSCSEREITYALYQDIVSRYQMKTIKYDSKNGHILVPVDEAISFYNCCQGHYHNYNAMSIIPWCNLNKLWSISYKMIDLSKLDLKFKPYDFQPEDIKTMLLKKVHLNANDMGCGKTFEAVVAGESLPMRKLVICPPTLRLNWFKEIKMVNPNAKINVVYNHLPFKEGDEWTIVGYPALEKYADEIYNKHYQCIFIDEAHYCMAVNSYGEPGSVRAKSVLSLTATAGYVYPITGTPIPTRNKNLWNILRMIRHPLTKGPDAWNEYTKRFCGAKKTDFGMYIDGSTNNRELNTLLTPYMTRHLKSEVLPHLTKSRRVIPVRFDITEYQDNLNKYVQSRKNKDNQQLTYLTRAKKCLAAGKVDETIAFAKDIISAGKKVIIVTSFTESAERLFKAFSGNCVRIVGGMTDKAKEKAKESFQSGLEQVMVMNIVAGGVGLTLTASHNVIFNDYDWNIGDILQAEDRVCRGDQTQACNIYYMTAMGVAEEEKLVDMLTYKSDNINNSVDGGRGDAVDFKSLVDEAYKIV